MPRGKRLDEEGGECITVTVTSNGILKYTRTATILGRIGNTPNYRYKTDDGRTIVAARGLSYQQFAKLIIGN